MVNRSLPVRNFGYAVAKAYAGHTDNGSDTGATATYVRATTHEVATALAALTGEPHPLATQDGSDTLIDALVANGSPAEIAGQLTRHLDAGADHVCLHLITEQGTDPLPGYRALAPALGLS